MSNIEVLPIAGAVGAEICGVDLSEPLNNANLAQIRKAFADHVVIFFRDQKITPEQHLAFGAHFGEFDVHRFVWKKI